MKEKSWTEKKRTGTKLGGRICVRWGGGCWAKNRIGDVERKKIDKIVMRCHNCKRAWMRREDENGGQLKGDREGRKKGRK